MACITKKTVSSDLFESVYTVFYFYISISNFLSPSTIDS